MYSENFVVPFVVGIHFGTLSGFNAHFRPGTLTIDGMDPTDPQNANALNDVQQGQTVEIAANTGDPQTDRDAVHIAEGLIQQGRDPWQKPGQKMQLPVERYNQAANFVRQNWLNMPAEPGGQVVAKWHLNQTTSADVSSDMSVTSKWKVVALGELQQPSGVGATQDYNPVVDGPNPDGPEIDNAQNSPEQEVAMQTWVNTAVDMLNRGDAPDAIIAKLAHDGCPNPEEILQRAQQQPMEEQAPVSDSIGQDPFQTPPPADQTGEMQSVSQQPAVLAKRVRIAGTTMTGTELDRWEGMWGEGQVKVALDEGGTINVAPDAIQPLEESYRHPVSEIQSFIDSMPEVEPTRPHIEARLANLELVRRAVRSTISKVALSDQVKLQEMDTAAEAEAALLKEVLGNLHEGYEVGYFAEQTRFAYNAFEVATPEITAWGGRPREAGAIWATENFAGATDDDNFKQAAAHYASNLGLTGSQFEQFLAGAYENFVDGLKNLPEVTSEENPNAENIVNDNDGPAEALFV